MAAIGIALSMWGAALRSELQYRANFVILTMMGVVWQCTGFAFIWVVLTRFQALAGWLPFQAQAFIPLSLYMGQVPEQQIAGALGLQLFWVVALFGVCWLVWQRAMRRVIIQGG